MYLDWISLFCLVLTIFIGVKKKMNTGILAIGIAFILGKIGGIDEFTIISGFNSSLFVMLLGVMYLFSIAQANGTIELFARKIIAIVGRKTYLIPFIIYIVSIFISAIGPGSLATLILMSVFAVSLAKEIDVSPLLLAPMAFFGTCVGGVSPLSSDGIIAATLASQQNITDLNGFTFFISAFISASIVVLCIYFKFGGHKIKVESPLKLEELDKFNSYQTLTLIGLLVLILVVFVAGFNVGLTSFVIATILLLLKASDEKSVLNCIAWGTLVLVTGFSVLMNVITQLGGITLLSNILSYLMIKSTAPIVMSISSSILGMFCSVSGVVMPTMISAVPDIVANVGANHRELIVAVVTGAHVGGISPITGGALILSAYATICKPNEDEHNKFYISLFAFAFFAAIIIGILGFLGLFKFL